MDKNTLTSLGELKEVLGRLWKSVDALKLSTQSDADKIAEKLDTWIATNRVLLESNQQLLKVIVENSQEVKRSARSYEHGSQILMQLQQQLSTFETATTELSKTLASQPAILTEVKNNEKTLNTNNNALQSLNQNLNQVLQTLQPLQSLQATGSTTRDCPLTNDIPLKSNRILRNGRLPLLGLGAACVLLGFGVAIAWIILQPSGSGVKSALTLDEVNILRWAKSAEGKLAQNLIRWNSYKLSDLECIHDVQRLGVTLAVDGRPATYGFCTLWVVPPEARVFEGE